ncbi:histone deacetylase complex subunit SAP18, putative [Plasmodium berghei]|uniref:Histone deacetylase complex subunit SAP18, putative n=2 Tax=Plasmodium berghei TaxID=5821 RepID=A0A509AM94_PLABA|nr:histone deacetylase complex subunit SAP18, putative [Plasmodium berghei ANKA]CXI77808.1 histone deacetylase complex subunit SAP18, putative [Plasmodium berghei]SCM25101.1 histone deacetylase complex subunit SAP18, putative [Plasmodium berghei]SCN27262.1 histone deacetylase complex subunit SAP18, putative [Plasmodium berghei]SCO61860.1 histone deacetylase complex subunit SAP18, putative [Plasmodium berghei]SCO63688.1 histone deacetylase complex subunit SAP18, putative [Plasmodium berghei]|eukprot:XP_034422898.1 histone deacetylase complex subunit SAP18, putative [Plasmodium berghei ANKA]
MNPSISKSDCFSDSSFSENNKNLSYQNKPEKTKKKNKGLEYENDNKNNTNKIHGSKEYDEIHSNIDDNKRLNNTKARRKIVPSLSQNNSNYDNKKIKSDLHDSSISISSFSVNSSKYEENKKGSKKIKEDKNITNNKKKNSKKNYENKGKKKKYRNSYSISDDYRSSYSISDDYRNSYSISEDYINSFSTDVSNLKRKGYNKKHKKTLSISSNSYIRYDNKRKQNNKSKDEYTKKIDKKTGKKKDKKKDKKTDKKKDKKTDKKINDYDKLSSISLSSFYSDKQSDYNKYKTNSKSKSKKKDKNKSHYTNAEKNTKLEKREKHTDKDKHYDLRKKYSDSYTTSIESLKSINFEKKKKKSEKKYEKKKYRKDGYSSKERQFSTSEDNTKNGDRKYHDRYFRNRELYKYKKYEKKIKYGEREKYENKSRNYNKNLIKKYGKRKYSTSRSLSYSNRYSIESKNYKRKRQSFSSDKLGRPDVSEYYSTRDGIKKIRKKKNPNNMNIITSSHSFSDYSINYRLKRNVSQEITWKKNKNIHRQNDNISIKYQDRKKNYERVHNYNNTNFEMLGVQLRRNKNYNEHEGKIFGITKYDNNNNNNISSRSIDIIGIINREKTCPFLLRLFYKTNVEYISVDDIDLNMSGTNNNELQIYAWIDITMREIVTLVKDFYEEGRKRNAQWIFNGYSFEKKKINFLSKVHSIKHNYKEDNKTLLSLNYEIGDIILLSIMFDK